MGSAFLCYSKLVGHLCAIFMLPIGLRVKETGSLSLE
jgi:hypothetical protein